MVTSVERNQTDIPTQFKLHQNYPNPFNPGTTIKYTIPNQAHVILKIFDGLGREIQTLVNEVKSAGTYELHWNSVKRPSGIYFYRIQTGSFKQVKKMLLIK